MEKATDKKVPQQPFTLVWVVKRLRTMKHLSRFSPCFTFAWLCFSKPLLIKTLQYFYSNYCKQTS